MVQTVVGSNVATLADWASRIEPDGKIGAIVELLQQKNEILDDMLWMEGNLPTGHRTIQRTGLPTVQARALNQGIRPSKSTTAPIDDAAASIEGFLEIDRDVANLNGDSEAFRTSEADAFAEAMSQSFANILFYGDSTLAPAVFNGFAPRYSNLSTGYAKQNIMSAGGSGSVNTSIYLVGWAENKVTGIFPKGTQAGIKHEDFGLQVIETEAGVGGARMVGYREHWAWKCGLAVRDWRYVVRGANIDTTISNNNVAADLIGLMTRMIDRLPSTNAKLAFYMNRTTRSVLRVQALNKSANAIAIEPGLRQLETKFLGIPIRICDQILNTEGTIT